MIKEYNLVVGNDNGNSEQDLVINSEKVNQPNVMVRVRKLPLLDEINPEYVMENIYNNLIVTIDSQSCELGHYYIGNYALKSGKRLRNLKIGGDNNKLKSEVVVVNTLGHIAAYGVRELFKEINNVEDINNTDIKINVDMATALPINQYSKENSNIFSSKFTNGEHKVTVHLGNIKVKVQIEFSFVKVIPEGVTGVFALTSEENKELFKQINKENNKNLKPSDLEDKKILHIAIGEGTTEYPITNGIVFDPNFARGSNNGIGHAINKSLEEFQKDLGLDNYSRQKYSEILKDKSHKFYPIAEDIIEPYAEDECEEILEIADQEIQKSSGEIDYIVIYGGGSIPFKRILEPEMKKIGEKLKIDVIYMPEEFAVILESIGLYSFANSELFKAIKSKYKDN